MRQLLFSNKNVDHPESVELILNQAGIVINSHKHNRHSANHETQNYNSGVSKPPTVG